LQEVDNLDKQTKQLKHDLYKLSWFMRGAVSVDEAFAMGPEDREIIGKIVEENLETTKKSGLSFF